MFLTCKLNSQLHWLNRSLMFKQIFIDILNVERKKRFSQLILLISDHSGDYLLLTQGFSHRQINDNLLHKASPRVLCDVETVRWVEQSVGADRGDLFIKSALPAVSLTRCCLHSLRSNSRVYSDWRVCYHQYTSKEASGTSGAISNILVVLHNINASYTNPTIKTRLGKRMTLLFFSLNDCRLLMMQRDIRQEYYRQQLKTMSLTFGYTCLSVEYITDRMDI